VSVPARDRTAPSDLREQLGVETPEHVELHLELAGVGSRAAAALFDTALCRGGEWSSSPRGGARLASPPRRSEGGRWRF